MLVYQLDYVEEMTTKFNVCSVNEDSEWFYLCWGLGKPFDKHISQPIIYYADYVDLLNDYPLTNGGQILVSQKVLDIISKSGASFDAYKSEIHFPNKVIIDNYYTINITEAYPILDRDNSIYEVDRDFPETHVRRIRKLVIKSKAIPKDKNLFRMGEYEFMIIATEPLVSELMAANITGMKFRLLEVA